MLNGDKSSRGHVQWRGLKGDMLNGDKSSRRACPMARAERGHAHCRAPYPRGDMLIAGPRSGGMLDLGGGHWT